MQRFQPILVWTMGKVGTTTVSRALARAGVQALHMHSVHTEVHNRVVARSRGVPPHVKASLRALELLKKETEPVRIISMIRDPIARNISAFFENVHAFGMQYDSAAGELIKTFKEQYPHQVPLRWFDRELKDGIGFDVFGQAFDRDARVSRYSTGRFEILVARIDADLSVLQPEISDFVGASLELVPENTAESKGYRMAYSKFKSRLSLSKDYVETMYSSTFARHFWTSVELAAMSLRHLNEGQLRPAGPFFWCRNGRADQSPTSVISRKGLRSGSNAARRFLISRRP